MYVDIKAYSINTNYLTITRMLFFHRENIIPIFSLFLKQSNRHIEKKKVLNSIVSNGADINCYIFWRQIIISKSLEIKMGFKEFKMKSEVYELKVKPKDVCK